MKKSPEKTCDDVAHIIRNLLVAMKGLLKEGDKMLKEAQDEFAKIEQGGN